MDDLKTTYNKIAVDWQKDHGSDTWWREGTDEFLSYLPPGTEVLDVGCGVGVKSEYLTKKGFRVIGFDFAEKMVELASRRVPTGTFSVLDMKDVASLGRTFEGILAQAVLLHIPKKDISTILRSLVSVLSPSGYLYAAVKDRRPGQPEEATVTENDYGFEYARFFSYFTPQEMKDRFERVGLRVVFERVTTSGKTNWIQIIGRRTA